MKTKKEINYLNKLMILGMTISRVFRVTCPDPSLLERVWDRFKFFLKTRIGFGAGLGLVIICPAPPRI